MKTLLKTVTRLFKNNIQIIILLFFILISFYFNRIPKDSSIAGGDFYQLINPLQHYSRYFYAWINQIGQGAFNSMFVTGPYYSLLALLDYLHFNSSFIAGFYIFFILYGSFLSFYLSISLIVPNIKRNIRLGSSLVYALNNFTFTIFSYPWGFTHHFLFYIFIPPLVILFIKIFLEKESLKNLVWFLVVMLLSLIAYNNLAFFAGLILLQLVITIGMLVLKMIKLDKEFFRKAVGIIVIYIISLWPIIIGMYSTIANPFSANTSVLAGGSLKDWIMATSNNFTNAFILALDQTRFPWTSSLKAVGFAFLYLIIFMILIYFLVNNLNDFKKKMTDKDNLAKKVLLFSGLLFVFYFLSVRAYGYFGDINLALFQLPFFNMFRSPEKIFSFIPFLYLMVIILLMTFVKLKDYAINLIFVLMLLIPHQFYHGGIVGSLARQDESKYNYVVKIPNEYYSAQKIVNQDSKNTSVVSLPFSAINSINWSNYPKWGYVGHDILHLLFNKNYISANVYDHGEGNVLSFKEYNEMGIVDEAKFLALLEKFSSEYVLWHKDIDPTWIKKSKTIKDTINNLEKKKILIKVEDNSYFTLYRLNQTYIQPIINTDEGKIFFEKISNSEYRVSVRDLSKTAKLNFNQTYNPQWKLYLDKPGQIKDCGNTAGYLNNRVEECLNNTAGVKGAFQPSNFRYIGLKSSFNNKVSEGYANSWLIDPDYVKKTVSKDQYKENADGSIDMSFTLFFFPQSYLSLSLWLNILIMVFSIGFITGVLLIRKRKNVQG